MFPQLCGGPALSIKRPPVALGQLSDGKAHNLETPRF